MLSINTNNKKSLNQILNKRCVKSRFTQKKFYKFIIENTILASYDMLFKTYFIVITSTLIIVHNKQIQLYHDVVFLFCKYITTD